MADHVRTLRKRLERMERAGAQNTGRPVNQRDKALVDALRAGIAALEKGGGAPRAAGKHPALGAPYGVHPAADDGQRHFIGGDEITPLAHGGYIRHEGMLCDGEVAARLSEPGDASIQPHPRWNAEKPGERHPQTVEEWNWHNDGPENGGGLARSLKRLAVAADYDDPRAPDQMAQVLRIDLIRATAALQQQTARAEAQKRRLDFGAMQSMVINMPQIDGTFIRLYDAECWRVSMELKLTSEDEKFFEAKARILHAMVLENLNIANDRLRSYAIPPLMPAMVDFEKTYRALKTVEEVQAAYDKGERVEWADACTEAWLHNPEYQNDPAIWPAWLKARNKARVKITAPLPERVPASEFEELPLSEHNQRIIRAWQSGDIIECRHIASTRWAKADPMAYGFDFQNFEYRVQPLASAICEHDWRSVSDAGGLIDKCGKCGEERA